MLGKEEDGANAEVPAPRPIQIHDLSLKVKEKPSFFLDVYCLKVWDILGLIGTLIEGFLLTIC